MTITSPKRFSHGLIGALLMALASPVWALTPTEVAKLIASDGATGDDFGHVVAVDGDTALIGAYGDGDDDNGSASGSAYVFTRSGGAWTQQAKLTASDGAELDLFGGSVALAGDTALIGARRDDDNGENSGSAYVFTRRDGEWTQQAKLTASDAARHGLFGGGVALADDTAFIGAFCNDICSGSSYIFTRRAGVWAEQAKLTASDAAPNDFFGYVVAVDGDTALVSAPLDDDSGDLVADKNKLKGSSS